LRATFTKSYPHERLFAGYLVFVAILLAIAGAPVPDRWSRLIIHLVGAAGFVILFPLLGETGWRSTVRHWLPVVLLALVYSELDTLNDMFTTAFHDPTIVAIDQALFRSQPAIQLREWFPFKPLSEYLHFAYFSYYFLFPILGVSLFLRGRLNEFRYAATVTLAVFALCYTIFILYPVSGPWNYYPQAALSQVGNFAPALVHIVLLKGESIGTAFPSSHVAVAVAVWMVAFRVDRRIFRFQALLVPALVVATVYGGFHYLIDTIVGVVVGVAGGLLGPRIYSSLGGTPPPLHEAPQTGGNQPPSTD
jgi:membrane-associated phospholipid phosphatase